MERPARLVARMAWGVPRLCRRGPPEGLYRSTRFGRWVHLADLGPGRRRRLGHGRAGIRLSLPYLLGPGLEVGAAPGRLLGGPFRALRHRPAGAGGPPTQGGNQGRRTALLPGAFPGTGAGRWLPDGDGLQQLVRAHEPGLSDGVLGEAGEGG